nr:hypothetical protein [Sphingopyxis sp. QXT-31]
MIDQLIKEYKRLSLDQQLACACMNGRSDSRESVKTGHLIANGSNGFGGFQRSPIFCQPIIQRDEISNGLFRPDYSEHRAS